MNSRLWRGLSESDRELLLDIGLFEWIDAGLIDEVLEQTGLEYRVKAMPVLDGLVESVRGNEGDAWRLHPLIRDHCARCRSRDTPARYRSIHRRIAKALERRGETVAAMRHAALSGDTDLIGGILQNVGGLRLMLREGLVRLQAADRFLNPAVMDKYPRLALARCFVLVMTGRVDEARKMYGAISARYRDAVREPGDDEMDFKLDECHLRGMLWLCGCGQVDSKDLEVSVADRERYAAMPAVDPLTRGSFEFGLGLVHQTRAEFDAALERLDRAEQCLHGTIYMSMFVNQQRGQIAMVQGRPSAARDWYMRARNTARESFLRDPGPYVVSEAFISELELERNRTIRTGKILQTQQALVETSSALASFAAASGVVTELTTLRRGFDDALAGLEEMRDFAQTRNLPALSRFLAASRVSLLVSGERVEDANRAWLLNGLPESEEECLDLRTQGWREMEAVACARLRLLVAGGQLDAGREFAGSLVSVAAERGLRRTWMRALALSVALENQAGRSADAQGRLIEFLRLFAETDYARPVVRERQACLPALQAVLEDESNSAVKSAAKRLLEELTRTEENDKDGLTLSSRELDVLLRLETQRDEQIAEAFELSVAGVRYHVSNIFKKLGVSGRQNAVHRARRIGLLPESVAGRSPD